MNDEMYVGTLSLVYRDVYDFRKGVTENVVSHSKMRFEISAEHLSPNSNYLIEKPNTVPFKSFHAPDERREKGSS